jgi:hypothetical protein
MPRIFRLLSGGRGCAVATGLRTTGIHVAGPRPWGTHFCHFSETTNDLFDTLVPYFRAGLESREYCVWVIADPLTEADARRALGHTATSSDDSHRRPSTALRATRGCAPRLAVLRSLGPGLRRACRSSHPSPSWDRRWCPRGTTSAPEEFRYVPTLSERGESRRSWMSHAPTTLHWHGETDSGRCSNRPSSIDRTKRHDDAMRSNCERAKSGGGRSSRTRPSASCCSRATAVAASWPLMSPGK